MVSSDASTRVIQGRLRLTIYLAAVVLLPAVIAHLVPIRGQFDPKPIARLQKKAPDLVLIGDSILGSSIEPQTFAKEMGASRAELFWNGGAASAAWYLIIKNYVVVSGIRPQMVCIFFRDRLLTDGSFRTTPTYRRYLESLQHAQEPVFRAVLEGDSAAETSILNRAIDWLYPLNQRRHVEQEKISRLAFRLASLGQKGVGPLRRRVNETFDVAKLRAEIMPEAAEVSGEKPEKFTADPKKNFLPHIVAAAKQSGLRLCFVREKRHPLADDSVAQTDALKQYIQELSRWLQSQGCDFVDLTTDPRLTQKMYLKNEDDHIRPGSKVAATRIYAAALRSLLAR